MDNVEVPFTNIFPKVRCVRGLQSLGCGTLPAQSKPSLESQSKIQGKTAGYNGRKHP